MYDPWNDHMIILDFSWSLDDILLELAKRTQAVAVHVSKRSADIAIMKKQVKVIKTDTKSLKADIKYIEHTEEDIRLRYLRVHKQVMDIQGMWPGLVGAHGSLNVRIEKIEDSLTKADIDIDLIEKEHKDIKIDVTKVENDVSKLSVEIDKLEVRIKSIEAKGPAIHDKIKEIIARIDVIEASFKNYDVSIDKAEKFDVDI